MGIYVEGNKEKKLFTKFGFVVFFSLDVFLYRLNIHWENELVFTGVVRDRKTITQ